MPLYGLTIEFAWRVVASSTPTGALLRSLPRLPCRFALPSRRPSPLSSTRSRKLLNHRCYVCAWLHLRNTLQLCGPAPADTMPGTCSRSEVNVEEAAVSGVQVGILRSVYKSRLHRGSAYPLAACGRSRHKSRHGRDAQTRTRTRIVLAGRSFQRHERGQTCGLECGGHELWTMRARQ